VECADLIDHKEGSVNVQNVRGDLNIKDGKGQVFLYLPQDGHYQIDAKSKIGAVESDFPGRGRRRLLIGHSFLHETTSSAQKLRLRIGFGDITILNVQIPSAEAARPPR
jgi:hypothetical protein